MVNAGLPQVTVFRHEVGPQSVFRDCCAWKAVYCCRILGYRRLVRELMRRCERMLQGNDGRMKPRYTAEAPAAHPLTHAPNSLMDPFSQQLAELCRTDVTRAKWVIVPSHAVGRTLGERIALSGTNWLNLRFVTPLDLALRMGAPFLVERGIEPSEEGLGAALMMRLLLDLPEKNGYFRPLADHPTMAQALWSTIRELRMAGVAASRSEQRKPSPRSSKHLELKALLAAYEQFLVRHESRGHGGGVPGGDEAPGLEPNPAGRLLDGTAGRRLESTSAHAARHAPR